MAQRITVELEDDLDGSPADTTVRFAVDGIAYEIDLSKRNAAAMRRTFERYIEHARKASRGSRRVKAPRDRGRSSDVRAWAKKQGIQLSDRGRIPASVLSQYEETHA